jgi:predicted secreted protein
MKFRIVFSVIIAAVAVMLVVYFLPRNSFLWKNPEIPEYSDPARIIETEAGREFVIILESNPTTGYGWQLGEGFDKAMLKVVEIRHNTPATQRVGAGGKDLWTFVGLRPGIATIPLEYIRPWEKGIPPVQKANFTVSVKNSKPL